MSTALEPTAGVESRGFEESRGGRVAVESRAPHRVLDGAVVGRLVGLTDNGTTPLVTFSGQPGVAALAARTAIDLHSAHIGRDVVLVFDGGHPGRPIVLGCLREANHRSLPDVPGHVEVDADGERLLVTANQGVVLRCGKASISLSRDGKVVIRGTSVVSHASGLNRIRGGSVQVN